jgi:hypothetical protein
MRRESAALRPGGRSTAVYCSPVHLLNFYPAGFFTIFNCTACGLSL